MQNIKKDMNAIAARKITDNFNTKQFWINLVESKIEEYAQNGLRTVDIFLGVPSLDNSYNITTISDSTLELVISELMINGFQVLSEKRVYYGASVCVYSHYITVSW
jgi:hypothetical protein